MFLDRPIGVFSLLDEECSFPQATNETLVQKFDKHFASNEFVTQPLNITLNPSQSLREASFCQG